MEGQRKGESSGEVLDGSNIMKLVGNEEVFSHFVDHKFEQLDRDHDGQLSVKELEPAVADIGAALGLPAQGASPDSDHIYSEVRAWSHSSLLRSFAYAYRLPVTQALDQSLEPFIVNILSEFHSRIISFIIHS